MKSLEQIFCLRPEYVSVLATKSSQTCRHKVQCVRKFLSRSGPLVNHHKLLCSQPGAEVRDVNNIYFGGAGGGGALLEKSQRVQLTTPLTIQMSMSLICMSAGLSDSLFFPRQLEYSA